MGGAAAGRSVLLGLLAPLGPYLFEVVFSMFLFSFLSVLAPKTLPKSTRNRPKTDAKMHFDVDSIF